MAGSVGDLDIRSDLQEEIEERLPKVNQDLLEQMYPFRRDQIAQSELRSRTTEAGTIDGFYTILRKVFQSAKDLDGIKHDIRFSKRYPTEDAELPCFTTKLIDRSPFNANGRLDRIMRPMAEYEDDDFPGGIIKELLTKQQNVVELKVWSTSTNTVDFLSEWVEKVYWEYLWAMKWSGYSHIVWLGRQEDRREKVRDQDVHTSSHRFTVVTDKLVYRRTAKLRKLHINVGINAIETNI